MKQWTNEATRKVTKRLFHFPFLFCFFCVQLGAKKGLGAQKVSSKSFSEVEKQAQVAEKLREEQAAEAKKQAEESM